MKMSDINKWLLTTLCLVVLSACSGQQEPDNKLEKTLALESPSGNLDIQFSLQKNQPYYQLARNKQLLLEPSRLGLSLQDVDLSQGFKLLSSQYTSFDETRRQPWGKTALVREHYNQLTVRLQQVTAPNLEMEIIFRAFDDGIALRYRLPQQHGLNNGTVLDELTEFRFLANYDANVPLHWATTRESVKLSDLNLVKKKSALYNKNEPKKSSDSKVPLLLRGGDNLVMAVYEANLINYTQMDVINAPELGPYALKFSKHLTDKDGVVAHFKNQLQTPWRVIMLGQKPGDLLLSNILTNLNPKSQITDTSWIKPGKATWDWRVHGAEYNGFEYGLNTASHKRFIEFAGANGIEYFLLDANWYGPEHDAESNPLTSIAEVDVHELLRHAKKHNVKMILYLNDYALINHDLDEILATYKKWGASGIKYGFMKGLGQPKVQRTMKIVEATARHQLVVDFHDHPIPPTGLSRTWPNRITVEFCHAQQDALRSFVPEHFLTMAFVNMIAGPLDMNNGVYALNSAKSRKYGPHRSEDIYSTVAAETARILITYSGLTVLPDAPEEYLKKSDLFEFIRVMPSTWDETQILHGKVGQHITTARRSGEQWFIGSNIDGNGGTLNIELDFLKPGVVYDATLYEDAPDTHYKTNKESYQVRKIQVKRGDVIPAQMAPGGGHSIWIRPAG